jgi:integrase-like protein
MLSAAIRLALLFRLGVLNKRTASFYLAACEKPYSLAAVKPQLVILREPTDNAYIESFNATARLECLGLHWFTDLDDAIRKVEDWRREYNEVRPHSAIGDRPPMMLIQKPRQSAEAQNRPEILI